MDEDEEELVRDIIEREKDQLDKMASDAEQEDAGQPDEPSADEIRAALETLSDYEAKKVFGLIEATKEASTYGQGTHIQTEDGYDVAVVPVADGAVETGSDTNVDTAAATDAPSTDESCRKNICELETYRDELCELHYYRKKHCRQALERYPRPLNYLVCRLIETNCEKWLTGGRSDAFGAEQIRKSGLTANQQEWIESVTVQDAPSVDERRRCPYCPEEDDNPFVPKNKQNLEQIELDGPEPAAEGRVAPCGKLRNCIIPMERMCHHDHSDEDDGFEDQPLFTRGQVEQVVNDILHEVDEGIREDINETDREVPYFVYQRIKEACDRAAEREVDGQ